MKEQILYISYDGMTDPLGMSQVLPYLFELSKKEYKIHLISFEKPERFETSYALLKESIENNGITWYPQIYHKIPPILSTLFDVRKMISTARKICIENDIKLIHCRSYIAAIAGMRISSKFEIPFIFDMRGFWADERVEGKIWNLKNPLYRLIYKYFKNKEGTLLSDSEAVISLTNKGKEIIATNFGNSISNKITVIPCCTDLSHFSQNSVNPELKRKFIKELRISESDKVLTYVGSLGTWYMSEEMVDFFVISLKKKVFTKFLVITKDPPSTLLDFAEKKGILKDCIKVRAADRNELPTLIDLGDWSLFFIRPSYSKSASSPTKMGELLAMGKGLIANKGIGDNDLLFSKYKCGLLVDDFTNDSYTKVLDQLIDYNVEGTRNTAEQYFSLEEGVNRYDKVYKSLLNKRSITHDDTSPLSIY